LTTVEEEEDAEDVPSVAVLPFDNMSGDPEQEYFADGITEDLITDLSKISGLLVIARNSVFTYKGKPIIVPDVCRELGVRWALEGSVRKSGNRVRINAQLIDGATGGHLWAERYDHNLDDIFAVQDEVAAEIVDALKVRVSRQEQSRLKRHGKVDMLIYDASLRAREKMWLSSAQATSEALEMFSEVVDKNPNNTACLALRAILTSIQFTNQWSDDPERSLENAVADAEKAISLDPNEFTAHWALGMVRHWQGRMEESRVASGRMIELAPGRPEGHALISSIEHYTGNPDAALEHANTAIKVDPFGPSMFVQMKGQAEFMLGDFEAAEVTLNKRIERSPETDTSRLYLASLYGHRGEVDAAREMWNEIFQVNPDYSLAKRLEVWPYSDDALPHRILEGLEKAGIDHQIEL
jgi:adenylate cyclase